MMMVISQSLRRHRHHPLEGGSHTATGWCKLPTQTPRGWFSETRRSPRHPGTHPVRFHVYEVQQSSTLIHGNGNQKKRVQHSSAVGEAMAYDVSNQNEYQFESQLFHLRYSSLHMCLGKKWKITSARGPLLPMRVTPMGVLSSWLWPSAKK